MNGERKAIGAGLGAVATAVGSALCCAGPIVAVTLGVSGAGLAAFEPLRPIFLVLTAASLLFGFYLLHREEAAACTPGKPCASASARRRMKQVLWIATIVAVALATFPRWQSLFL